MTFSIDESKSLKHYGILRESGRYPWGSGENPYQRSMSFFDHVAKARAKGLSDVEIALGFGLTTTDFRIINSIARNQKRAGDISKAMRLKETGMSNVAIGTEMKIPESSVRSLLAPGQKEKTDILLATSNMVRDQVDRKGVVDIGKGNENWIGVSKERLAAAVSILKAEGYQEHKVQVDQVGTRAGNKTTVKVLAKPETTYKDIVSHPDYPANIKTITEMSGDKGRSYFGVLYPMSIDSSRISVIYREDGGAEADGVMFVRPGKEDVSLGGSRYAQVRVMVDGTHYLKGMAMYRDDLPPGIDIAFNTNKTRAQAPTKLDAMKPLKTTPEGEIDKANPFGAVLSRQIGDLDSDGHVVKLTSAMNVLNEEGDWNEWKKTLSTQILSKQNPTLVKSQLDLAYERSKSQLDEIMALTNPTVKKKMLEDFAETADSSAVHMKAAALPRQRSQVILPLNSLKPTEIYAPNFRDGERVALIRHPHAGPFEIPELIVNNKHREAKSLLGQADDAVAINSEVAKRLSGADFDGDTVLVIPNPINNPKLKTEPALKGLENFDPQTAYPAYEGMATMNSKQKGQQMGLVSNLITDMTIKGASPTELAAAVRHSMAVIDAEKHPINWKESARVNGIPNLMEKYQHSKQGGSDTLISRAKSREDVPRRKARPASEGGPIDPATGKKVYKYTGESWTDAKGKLHVRTQRSTKLAETDDAHTLVSLPSGTRVERLYADHSNRLKALANTARRESLHTGKIEYNPSANKAFKPEVDALTAKLHLAERNAPLERQAQVIAGSIVKMKRQSQPDMDSVQLKKISGQALEEARRRMGAKKQRIEITADEWAAIQSGAITPTRLERILNNTDPKVIKQLATPRTHMLMTSLAKSRARQMFNAGYTQAEIADQLGVSISTLKRGLSDG